MDGALKILLLAAVTLLVSAETFGNYRSFNDDLRRQIDRALENANGKFGSGYHVAFHSLASSKQQLEENKLYVNVILQVTTCPKTSPNAFEHRDNCSTRRKKTPLIDCLVCKRNDDYIHKGDVLVHCEKKLEVMNKQPEIRSECDRHYHGSNTAFLKTDDDKEIGCVGCL